MRELEQLLKNIDDKLSAGLQEIEQNNLRFYEQRKELELEIENVREDIACVKLR